jgi:hypothetical protein
MAAILDRSASVNESLNVKLAYLTAVKGTK